MPLTNPAFPSGPDDGYKHRTLDSTPVKAALSAPNFLLKIVPHVDGIARIRELVRYFCEDVTVKRESDVGLATVVHDYLS
jgi:acetoacetate decarboxylase